MVPHNMKHVLINTQLHETLMFLFAQQYIHENQYSCI